MKTPIVSSLALVAGVASAIVPVVALIPLNTTALFGVLAGFAGLGILAFAWADYTRKPRFRMHTSRKSAVQPDAAGHASVVDASAGWTHQTVSA